MDKTNLPVCVSCGKEISFRRWDVKADNRDDNSDEGRIFVCTNDQCELSGKEIRRDIENKSERLQKRSENILKSD